MKREESLGYVINHVARLFAKALYQEISDFGVVPGQFAQLLALYERDGITQQELCDLVQIEQPTMANTLRRMERDGLIARSPHPDDGRKQVITLTPEARQLEPPLMTAAQRINQTSTRGLTKAERQQLMTLIEKLTTNLENVYS